MSLRITSVLVTYFFCMGLSYAHASEIDKFVETIQRLKPWAYADRDKFKAIADDYNRVGKDFQSVPVEDARQIVKQIADELPVGGDVETASKLYVLLRFYFAVPEYVERSEYRAFGGGWGVPEDDKGRLGTLWPLAVENNELQLTSQFRLFKGAAYRALDEFDHFNKNYGPRKQ
jgi:hypothetical protein